MEPDTQPDRMPCKRCGLSVLAKTIEKYDGLCRSCHLEPERIVRNKRSGKWDVAIGILGLLISAALFYFGAKAGFIAIFYGLAIVSIGAIFRGFYMMLAGREP